VPAKTPPAVVQRINAEIMKAMRDPDVLARYATMGVDPVAPHSPEAFGKFLQGEVDRWVKVIRDAHVTVQ